MKDKYNRKLGYEDYGDKDDITSIVIHRLAGSTIYGLGEPV